MQECLPGAWRPLPRRYLRPHSRASHHRRSGCLRGEWRPSMGQIWQPTEVRGRGRWLYRCDWWSSRNLGSRHGRTDACYGFRLQTRCGSRTFLADLDRARARDLQERIQRIQRRRDAGAHRLHSELERWGFQFPSHIRGLQRRGVRSGIGLTTTSRPHTAPICAAPGRVFLTSSGFYAAKMLQT